MNFFETTYSALHGPGNSLVATRPIESKPPFFTTSENHGPLWGFNEQAPPGVPGPEWVRHGSSGKEGVSSCRPSTTYQDSYQFRRRHFDILSYDANEQTAPVPSIPPERGGTYTTQKAGIGRRELLYSARFKSDRRHDTLSQSNMTESASKGALGPSAFETSAKAIGSFSGGPQTLEQTFASQKAGERKRVNRQRRMHRAGLNGFEDSLRAFPPKAAACKRLLAAAKTL